MCVCVCVCVRGKGREVGKGESEGEGGWGSCDPTAPRPASQAGETQAHVGAPLTRHKLVEASPRRGGGGGLGRPAACFGVLSLVATPYSAAAHSLLLCFFFGPF